MDVPRRRRRRTTEHHQARIWGDVANERDRVVNQMARLWHYMLGLVQAGPGVRFLDAGCGSGGASIIAKQLGANVTGVDLAPPMIELCRNKPELAGCTFEVASLEKLPFADGSFDAAMASMVIHFCEDSLRAARELHRVLAPGARLAISAPASPDMDALIAFRVAAEFLPDEAADILRPLRFAPAGALLDLLAQAGFETAEETFLDDPIGRGTWEQVWSWVRVWAPVRTVVDRLGEEAYLAKYRERIAHLFYDDTTLKLGCSWRVVTATR